MKRSVLAIAGSALLLVGMPQLANAQEDVRLERIEAQLRALQRKVFPGGDARFFEPEIVPQGQTSPNAQPVGVTGSALTDVLTRLTAIESQLARLTAATEVNENALRSLEERMLVIEGGAAPMPVATSASAPAPTPVENRPSGVIPVPDNAVSVPVAATPAATPAPSPSGPTPARVAAVQAIAKPATGDAGDDEYTYGFRLWDAGFFPEAQQQLSLFVGQYPAHWRTTYGRNLLGRAFLDAGEPRKAATHFFDNYQSDKQAARAPDSLLFLAESMIQLADTRRACIALAEFGDTYAPLAVGRLQSQYDGLRGRVDCD